MTMVAALLFAQGAVGAGVPGEPPASRIVVTAERLRSIEASVGQDQDGRWRCSLSGSSGSGWIDGRLCDATTQCVREHGNDRELIGACVAAHRSGILADFRRASGGDALGSARQEQ